VLIQFSFLDRFHSASGAQVEHVFSRIIALEVEETDLDWRRLAAEDERKLIFLAVGKINETSSPKKL
jgi:hypothetical protein